MVDAAGTARAAAGALAIRARQFPVQRLTLPAHQVDLDPETARRAEAEAAALRALYDTSTPERLWRGAFTRPVGGDGEGHGFGARRIINGQPRRPHAGLDYSAPKGTPVVAANRGRVALVGDFFFPGRLVALDHGLGLYTLYMHLDRVDVAEGAMVERGEALGAVGATGRATGPHLHFGAQARPGARGPAGLLSLRAATDPTIGAFTAEGARLVRIWWREPGAFERRLRRRLPALGGAWEGAVEPPSPKFRPARCGRPAR